MALACVNNIPTTYSTSHTNWFSPRTSLSRDYNNNTEESRLSQSSKSDLESSSSNNTNAGDFNFELGTNTVTMLPADELFSDGKLLPLHLSTPKQQPSHLPSQSHDDIIKTSLPTQKEVEKASENPYLFSPKAPRCSSRWKELLGLKKPTVTSAPTSTTATTTGSSGKSIRQLLNRSSKTTSSNSSMSLPLLKDSSSSSSSSFSVSEQDPNNVHSSRLSLSSSSSTSNDELPRLSLDLEKPKPNNQPKRSLSTGPKVRPLRPRTRKKETTATSTSTVATATKVSRGVTIDSPRMNPSGRVVFESLERSSSCPSSFNGGLKYKNNYNKRVMERSYSGNVVNARITPVLNVPVYSLRGSSKFGFGQLFSSSQSQKKEGNFNGGNSYVKNYNQHTSSKIKDKNKESSQ